MHVWVVQRSARAALWHSARAHYPRGSSFLESLAETETLRTELRPESVTTGNGQRPRRSRDAVSPSEEDEVLESDRLLEVLWKGSGSESPTRRTELLSRCQTGRGALAVLQSANRNRQLAASLLFRNEAVRCQLDWSRPDKDDE
ncbi:hypothetical protein EYF80_035397 [Liparis tanakae]|uniref:Uncharacterized protein n=1 Tax=Liparis tanakae TaxID=230148 RepID=A0A4Z2GM27_9TELE|nr:hypothetical protein EYF80_035397 [Liparis tanakae]